MLIEKTSLSEPVPVFGIRENGGLLLETGEELRYSDHNEQKTDWRIIDRRKSAFWENRGGEWAFPEWFRPYFGINLANGAAWETRIVKYYRELFLREYPRDDLASPEYYGRGLIRCPKCGRIFEPLSFLGVVRCNGYRCRLEMNNPFYDPERLKESCEWGRLEYELPGPNGYYYVKTQRYYPAPPTVFGLGREWLVRWLEEYRKTRRRKLWRQYRRR